MKTILKKLLRSNYGIWRFALWVRSIPFKLGRIEYHNNGGCVRIKKDIAGSNNLFVAGRNSMVHNLSLYIRGNSVRVEIGEGTIIGHGCSIRCEGDNITVIVGKNTTMTRDIHICAQESGSRILIGEDCMFSNNIIVRTSDSHPIYDAGGERINPPADVRIGNHVWMAPESTVLKGVVIGDNAIIGSKSLVTKNVEPGCLYAGIPARLIKENVSWTREELF